MAFFLGTFALLTHAQDQLPLTPADLAQLQQAASQQIHFQRDTEKREAAFEILKQLHKRYPDNPRVSTQFYTALSLKAKYAQRTEQKVFWSKRADLLINRTIKDNPDYLLAYATRATNNALAPAFLGLNDKIVADFEFVLHQKRINPTPDDDEAFVLSHHFYANYLAAQVEAGKLSKNQLARVQALRTELKQRYPKLDPRQLP